MIIVEIKGKTNIESALKTLKNKFIKTKTVKELNERKTFTKKSDKKRAEIKKAIYTGKMRNSGLDTN
jgi:small subunit ribosomal protein S21